jgi:hypothetical protein
LFKKLFVTLCVVSALQMGSVVEAAAHHPQSASLGSTSTYSISPGLAFVGSFVGPSINSYIGIAPADDRNFFVGLDLGVALFFPSSFVMSFSVLPAAWYQFALPRNQNIKLVAGIELGPNILVGGGGGALGSRVTYEFLVRPGFIMETSDSTLIGVDLKFGSLGGAFVFKPQFNLIFKL